MATIITYSFIIGNDTIPYSATAEITIDKVKYDASLLSLRYHKKMFQPGKIEAKLQLKQKTNELKKAPEISKLVSYFKTQKNNVSLSNASHAAMQDAISCSGVCDVSVISHVSLISAISPG